MARKNQPEGKKYSYMDTYGDLVTLLLCFFVLLFSMSSVDQTKYNAIIQAFSEHFGNQPLNITTVSSSISTTTSEFAELPPTGEAMDPNQVLPADMFQLAEAIERYVEENNLQGSVQVERGENGTVFLRLNNSLMFEGDSYELLPGSIPTLRFLGECFVNVEDQIFRITCNGHTADVPGSGTDDWILSGGRAGAVASYFEKVAGIPGAKVVEEAFGRTYPIADNADPVARAANRRVDIVVVGNNPETFEAALLESLRVYFPGDDIGNFQGDPADLPGATIDAMTSAAGTPSDLALSDLTEEELAALQQELGQEGAGGEDSSG